MTTFIIQGIPKPVAIGLDWHVLPGLSSVGNEKEALSKQLGIKIGASVTSENTDTTVVGFSSERRPGALCGAAWLAKSVGSNSVVLAEPLENNKVWLCAIRAGTPVQNLDVVIPVHELQERLLDFVGSGQDVRIYSTIENLFCATDANISPRSFKELVANVKPERLVRLSGLSPELTWGAILIAGGLIGWYFGSNYLDEQAAIKGAQNSAEARLQQKVQAEDLERRSAAIQRESAHAWLRASILRQPSISAAVAAAFKVINGTPTSVAGWYLNSFGCSPSACDFTWGRTKAGTTLTFIQEAEQRGWRLLSLTGDIAVTEVPFMAEQKAADINDLVDGSVFRVALESRLQTLQLAGLTFQLPASIPLENVMAPAPAPPGASEALQPASTQKLPWKVGEFSVRGSELFALAETPLALENPGIALKHLSANLKENQWTLEMKYATQ